jgi:hypothetical protein
VGEVKVFIQKSQSLLVAEMRFEPTCGLCLKPYYFYYTIPESFKTFSAMQDYLGIVFSSILGKSIKNIILLEYVSIIL